MNSNELRKKIKRDLIKSASANINKNKCYLDLIDDYMILWDTKNKLIKDIEERGVVVDYVSNSGITNKKKNESVGDLLKVNQQMTKLLDSLGIVPSNLDGDADDEM